MVAAQPNGSAYRNGMEGQEGRFSARYRPLSSRDGNGYSCPLFGHWLSRTSVSRGRALM
jgi:hypothetical protein